MQSRKLSHMDYAEIRHLLPRNMQEIIFLTSVETAFILIEHYGGRVLRISKNKTLKGKASFQKLAALIGEKHAQKLTIAYANTQRNLFIPQCNKAISHLRNKRIIARFDELIKQCNEYQTINVLVLEFGLSDRQIRTILKNTT